VEREAAAWVVERGGERVVVILVDPRKPAARQWV